MELLYLMHTDNDHWIETMEEKEQVASGKGLKPKAFRRLMNCYPPYIGAGVRLTTIAEDWHYIQVEMKLRWYNRNYMGTHFGGNIYTMVDPHLVLMLIKILGSEYLVWDKSADINFIKASRHSLVCDIALTDADVEDIKRQTENGGKYQPVFTLLIHDKSGQLVAEVKKELYIRKKR